MRLIPERPPALAVAVVKFACPNTSSTAGWFAVGKLLKISTRLLLMSAT